MQGLIKHVKRSAAGFVRGFLLGTCIAAGQALAEEAASPVFYPPAPDLPRIQYLLTLSGERDMAPPKSDFAAFVLGDEDNSQQLTQPYGVAMYDRKIYVADTGAGAIAVFDMAKKSYSMLTGSGNGRIKRPINIRIDTDGTKYVTDTVRDQILIYDRNDRFVKAYGGPNDFRPVDVAIAADKLYVSDLNHHQIHVLDKHSGKTLLTFGKPGSGDGELFHPTNISLGAEGDLYVVETSNYRVQRFTADGKFVRTYGAVGSTPGSFARPKGIAIDRDGRMYVGDAAFENVQVFNPDGKLLVYFGQPEEGERLNLPAGVSIDYENVSLFSKYARNGFSIEYLVFVSSQFGPNKIDVFGFGKMPEITYPSDFVQKSALLN